LAGSCWRHRPQVAQHDMLIELQTMPKEYGHTELSAGELHEQLVLLVVCRHACWQQQPQVAQHYVLIELQTRKTDRQSCQQVNCMSSWCY
jgi:hypothetical protein